MTLIKISVDSGANIHSEHSYTLDLVDLGADNLEEWNSWEDEERWEAVVEYWNSNGYPEYTFEIIEND